MGGLRLNRQRQTQPAVREECAGSGMLSQELFLKLLGIERKRTERSGRRFVLMLLETGNLLKPDRPRPVSTLLAAIARATRATDLTGWYKEGSIIGVIFTEIGSGSDTSVVHSISSSLTDSLYSALTIQQINEIKLSFHLFPEDWEDPDSNGPVTTTVRLALAGELHRKKGSLVVKRMIDIVGSIAALLFFLPLMVIIACAIKLTSKGPVIFRQVRLGQYGQKFTFLKFRSMYTGHDHTIHKEYVTQFIEGTHKVEEGGSQQPVYKLTADPRITRVGRFLRNTSLDELPQFMNVLRGDMSLVGPRPPVLYEFECYDLWHKRRLLAVKPGITGLWQVDGRSRVKFDEMVRLDIRYARSWSLWLDLKILLQTPRAVLSRSGAC